MILSLQHHVHGPLRDEDKGHAYHTGRCRVADDRGRPEATALNETIPTHTACRVAHVLLYRARLSCLNNVENATTFRPVST